MSKWWLTRARTSTSAPSAATCFSPRRGASSSSSATTSSAPDAAPGRMPSSTTGRFEQLFCSVRCSIAICARTRVEYARHCSIANRCLRCCSLLSLSLCTRHDVPSQRKDRGRRTMRDLNTQERRDRRLRAVGRSRSELCVRACVCVCVCVELVVILVEVVAVVVSAWAEHAYAWQSLRQSLATRSLDRCS